MSALPCENTYKILSDFDKKYGADLLNSEKCREIFTNLSKQKRYIESQLDATNTDGFVGKSITEGRRIVDRYDVVSQETHEVVEHIETDLNEISVVRTRLKSQFDKLNALRSALQYIRIVQHTEVLCDDLKRDVTRKDDEKCVTAFLNLTEISRNLSNCPVTHLNDYLRETMQYWHDILEKKFLKDFEEILKQLKWPFISSNFSLVTPMVSQVEKLQIVTEYLLQIEIPTERYAPPPISEGVLSHFTQLCLPVHYLVHTLRKRFLYHFYGNRQTNRPDKPEWYFTQVLTWIRDHKDWVENWIQPVIGKLGLHHIDAKLEFMRGLVQLAVEKLNSELPSLQFDNFTFSHSIDEALAFDKELKEVYNYPASEPGIILVLTQAHVFVKWLVMERKYATEKMDVILSPNSIEAFDLITSDVQDLKITTCADAFITLLQTITERCENLPQPGHRLQFLELQLELLDDFRVRLLQLVNAEEGNAIESKLPMIANTVYYIENVLTDWGSMLHYLNLYYYKNQLDANTDKPSSSPTSSDIDDGHLVDFESDSVFAETLSLYRHFRRSLLCILAETVIAEVKSKSWYYRRERWSSMNLIKEFRSMSLTPSACPIFEVLAKRLHQLKKSLQQRLFTVVWRNIATQLDTYLFEDLVMDNRFNDGGALQLKFDVTRNLLPLFSQFSDKPANYFTQLMESWTLLNLSKGSALLLRETLIALEGATGVEDTRGKTLKEIGVSNFSPMMAVKILNQRTDITVNRITVD